MRIVNKKQQFFSVKSPLFYTILPLSTLSKSRKLTEVSDLLKLRFRILTKNKITNI